MRYEEMTIDGVLHFRDCDDYVNKGEWTPYTAKELTFMLCETRNKRLTNLTKYIKLHRKLTAVRNDLDKLNHTITDALGEELTQVYKKKEG